MNHHDGSPRDSGGESADCAVGEGQSEAEWTSLSGFQRDLLVSITMLEQTEGPPSGITVKRDLSKRYGSSINHGRLYQNLDELVETGLVEKSFYDGRTNAYRLTSAGQNLLRHAAITMVDTCDAELMR